MLNCISNQCNWFDKISKKVKLTLLIIISGLLVFCVQTYTWVDAGKSVEDKSYAYSFQMNFWNEKVREKFDLLAKSGVAPRVMLSKEKKTVNGHFLRDLVEYRYHLQEILRVLKFNNNVSFQVLGEITRLSDKGVGHVDDMAGIVKDVEKFQSMLEVYDKKADRIQTFLPELAATFEYNDDMTDSERVNLTVKQVKLLKELYSSDDLFLKRNKDPFEFVRDMGDSAYTMLANYEKVLAGYNLQVSREETYKKIILLLLTIISVYLSIRVALIPDEQSQI